LELAKLVSLAELESAISRPTGIRAEMHLVSALFGGEDAAMVTGRVEFREDVAEVSGSLSRKVRSESVLARLRASFELERMDTAGTFRATLRRKPASLPAAPIRDAVQSWQ
jgi:hypothetical protein